MEFFVNLVNGAVYGKFWTNTSPISFIFIYFPALSMTDMLDTLRHGKAINIPTNKLIRMFIKALLDT
jgi:hypothetical protein